MSEEGEEISLLNTEAVAKFTSILKVVSKYEKFKGILDEEIFQKFLKELKKEINPDPNEKKDFTIDDYSKLCISLTWIITGCIAWWICVDR